MKKFMALFLLLLPAVCYLNIALNELFSHLTYLFWLTILYNIKYNIQISHLTGDIMLLQFTFKNFRSFKDKNTLDMRATKVKELSYHIRNAGKEKVLPITAIYGANASGKSNVIEAISFMKLCVTSSVTFGLEIDDNALKLSNNNASKFLYNDNVRFSFMKNTDETNSLFEIVFILPNKKKYVYGFIIDKNGFKEEWLKQIKSNNTYKDIITRINYKTINYNYNNKQTKIKDIFKKSLTNTSLILTLGTMLNNKFLTTIYNWFSNMKIINFGKPLIDMIASQRIISEDLITGKLKNIFLGYLASFDNSVIDYSIEKQLNEDDDDPSYQIYTHHKMLDNNGTKKLSLQNESSGTQKMITLFLHFHEVIQNGYTIFIDELNAKLHPLLVRLILNMFSNPETNPNNAQLIFTTHDSWLMKKDILRRDEIWFTDKNEVGISELYSLVEFKDDNGKNIRNDENYEKNYLLGKYGAIPHLSLIKLFDKDYKENNDE